MTDKKYTHSTEQSVEVRLALLEKEIEDLQEWKDTQEANTRKAVWGVFVTFFTAAGFIISKAWEKTFP